MRCYSSSDCVHRDTDPAKGAVPSAQRPKFYGPCDAGTWGCETGSSRCDFQRLQIVAERWRLVTAECASCLERIECGIFGASTASAAPFEWRRTESAGNCRPNDRADGVAEYLGHELRRGQRSDRKTRCGAWRVRGEAGRQGADR